MRRTASALALAALVVLAACGDDDGGAAAPTTAAPTTAAPATAPATTAAPTTTAAAFPVTVEGANGTVTLDERPDAIVSLSPTATEMLFAIGAGPQVVAVDDQSTFPDDAPRTDLTGLEPNLEAIAAYEPDLVVVSNDIRGVLDGLASLDIPALLLPAAADLDGTYEQLEVLGAATGNADGAAELVASMQTEIDELVASAPDTPEALTYFHELDPTLYTATSGTFIGQVYALAGLENVGDAADDGSGYPQLSAEFLVAADPDLIFLADTKCCGESAATVAARPGWAELTAVQAGNVVELDDDVASRWGPRVVEFLAAVVAAMEATAG
jgi:iron complex transport system substrate-binding protein